MTLLSETDKALQPALTPRGKRRQRGPDKVGQVWGDWRAGAERQRRRRDWQRRDLQGQEAWFLNFELFAPLEKLHLLRSSSQLSEQLSRNLGVLLVVIGGK